MCENLLEDEQKKYWPEKYSCTFSALNRVIFNIMCNSLNFSLSTTEVDVPKYNIFCCEQ